MAEKNTLYKLMILYMLKNTDFALTYSQISDFLVGKGYAHFFSLQSSIGEMLESSLVHEENIRKTHYYSITPEGEETLQYFHENIPRPLRDDIEEYLKTNRLEMLNEYSVLSDYYKDTKGSYKAHCVIREKDEEMLSLTLTVPDEKQAEAICSQWKEQSEELYELLVQRLMR